VLVLTADLRACLAAVAELIDEGHNNVEIAEVLGVDETTVCRDISTNVDLKEKKSGSNRGGSKGKSTNVDAKPPQQMLSLQSLGEPVPVTDPPCT
jgi:hypothetical protein